MIFPIAPLTLCIAGGFISLACQSKVGITLSFAAMVAVVITDAHLLKQRAKRPDFNPWDEI